MNEEFWEFRTVRLSIWLVKLKPSVHGSTVVFDVCAALSRILVMVCWFVVCSTYLCACCREYLQTSASPEVLLL